MINSNPQSSIQNGITRESNKLDKQIDLDFSQNDSMPFINLDKEFNPEPNKMNNDTEQICFSDESQIMNSKGVNLI